MNGKEYFFMYKVVTVLGEQQQQLIFFQPQR